MTNIDCQQKSKMFTNAPDLLNVSINIKKQPQRKSLVYMHQSGDLGVVLRVTNFP